MDSDPNFHFDGMDQDLGPDPKEKENDHNFAKIKCQIFYLF